MGNRLFELGLGPLALAYCGAGGKDDQRAIKSLLAEHGKEGFNAAWTEHKGLRCAADFSGPPIKKLAAG